MKGRITPSLVVAVVALVVALTGSAVAATLITSRQIADGTIQNRDIHKGTVSLNRLSEGTQKLIAQQSASSLANVKDGGTGPQGAQGPQGEHGPKGVSGYEVKTYDYIDGGARPGHDGEDSTYGGVGTGAVATVACSSGKVATGGGYFFRKGSDDSAPYGSSGWAFGSPAGTDGTTVIASFPGRMDWGTATVKPGDNSGWIVQVNSASAAAHDLTVYVICVNAN